jgi:hypothetical protein
MATRIPNAVQDAAVNAIAARVDAGAGPGVLRIYTGAQPADADDAPTGTLLVSITLADPAFGASSAGVAQLAGTPRSGTAVASGTAGWFRIVDSNGVTVVDGSVTATGGGGDLELDNTNIATGQQVSVSALSLSIPASE